MPAGLYLVATPIGNLGDLAPRAQAVLARADAVYCEDTRITAKLLATSGIKRPLKTYHEHNAERIRDTMLADLDAGKTLALCSDAGTPLVSDPGYKLVREARARGIQVVPIPGPSAALAALVASGLPTDRFVFQGFLPQKAAARHQVLDELKPLAMTLVFFESPLRTAATLEALGEALGDREAVVARELTKRFEEFRCGRLAELAADCRARPPKGEVVLVVGGAEATVFDTQTVDDLLLSRLADVGPSEAAREVARATGRPRQALYRRALALRSP